MAKKDIELTIGVMHPSGLKEAKRAFKGSFADLQKFMDRLNVDSFGKKMKVTADDVQRLRDTIRGSRHELEAGGKGALYISKKLKDAAISAKQMSKGGKAGNIEYSRYGNKLKAVNVDLDSMVKKTARLKFASNNAARGTDYLRRKLNDTFTQRRNTVMNTYAQSISKIKTQINVTGTSSEGLNKKLKLMEDGLAKVSATDINPVVNAMQDIDEISFDNFNQEVEETFAKLKGEMQGITSSNPATKVKAGIENASGGIMQQFGGAAGFASLEVGNRIQELMSNMRVENAFGGLSRKLGSSLGSVFGGAVGAISADFLGAMGKLGEIAVNLLTLKFRALGNLLGVAFKITGFTMVSSMLTGMAAAMPAAGTMVAAITLVLGLTTFVKEFVAEVQNMVKQLFTAIIGIISAGMKALGAVLRAGAKIISAIVVSVARGIKQTVTALAQALMETTKRAVQGVTQFVASGLNKFIELQTGAVRAAKEIADKGDNVARTIHEINRTRINFGFDKKDSAAAYFDIVSSGFRDFEQQQMFMRESAKLAVADQSTVANAANALITVYHNYGKELSDVRKISDMLSTATTLGRTSLEELGPALKNVVGISKFAGLGLQDLLTSITAMTKIFGRGSTKSITRFLSRFVEAVSNPTSRAREEFEKLGVSVNSLGNGDFSDKFVKLLHQLKGIRPDQLRTFFPTIQSRKAFTALVADVKKYEDTLADVREQQNLQAKQLKLIGKQLTHRIKQVKEIASIAKESVGQVAASLLRVTLFSDKAMVIWFRLGHLINDSILPATMKFARFLYKAGKPVFSRLLPAMDSMGVTLKNIASIDPFQSNAWRDFGISVNKSLRSVLGVYDSIETKFSSSAITAGALQAFLDVSKKFRDVIDKMMDESFSFTDLKDKVVAFAKDYAKVLARATRAGLTSGLNKAADVFTDLNAMLLKNRAEGLDLDIEVSPENTALFEAMKAAAGSFAVLLKNALITAFEELGSKLGSILKDSTDPTIQTIRNALDNMLMLADVALTGIKMVYGPAKFTEKEYGSIYRESEKKTDALSGQSELVNSVFGKTLDEFRKDVLREAIEKKASRGKIEAKLLEYDRTIPSGSKRAARLAANLRKLYEDFDSRVAKKSNDIGTANRMSRAALLDGPRHEARYGRNATARARSELTGGGDATNSATRPQQHSPYGGLGMGVPWHGVPPDAYGPTENLRGKRDAAAQNAKNAAAAAAAREAAERKNRKDPFAGEASALFDSLLGQGTATEGPEGRVNAAVGDAKAQASDIAERSAAATNAKQAREDSTANITKNIRKALWGAGLEFRKEYAALRESKKANDGMEPQEKSKANAAISRQMRELLADYGKQRAALKMNLVRHLLGNAGKQHDKDTREGMRNFANAVRDTAKALQGLGHNIKEAKGHIETVLHEQGLSPVEVAYALDKKGKTKEAAASLAKYRKQRAARGFNAGTPRVPGVGNTDSVPAMLTPGEAVIPKKSVQYYGSSVIQGIIGRRASRMASGGIAASRGNRMAMFQARRDRERARKEAHQDFIPMSAPPKPTVTTQRRNFFNKERQNRIFGNGLSKMHEAAKRPRTKESFENQILSNARGAFKSDDGFGKEALETLESMEQHLRASRVHIAEAKRIAANQLEHSRLNPPKEIDWEKVAEAQGRHIPADIGLAPTVNNSGNNSL